MDLIHPAVRLDQTSAPGLVYRAGISSGKLFRRVNGAGRVSGEGMTDKVVWHVVKEFVTKVDIINWRRTA